jgi:hypothetical protein
VTLTLMAAQHLFTEGIWSLAQQLGAKLHRGRVTGLVREEGGGEAVVGVQLDDGTSLRADCTVLCMGPWSSQATEWEPSIPRVTGNKENSIVVRAPSSEAITAHAVFVNYTCRGKLEHPEIYPRPGSGLGNHGLRGKMGQLALRRRHGATEPDATELGPPGAQMAASIFAGLGRMRHFRNGPRKYCRRLAHGKCCRASWVRDARFHGQPGEGREEGRGNTVGETARESGRKGQRRRRGGGIHQARCGTCGRLV